ncbi:ubiquitin-specific protease 15 [Arabidopsis lyrata subsp. lyrata]|uniref:ubiquitinyl hydrolase 1 n=1 Tax=Arabidopsis lyrata subsp. lyrata TaxID=81972 RepID=D7KEL9_ARALL|nr:ubiquitin carboxyl-terminal hydrolase 15 isoform X2 [Arabidopsis lyrata subsp. lyrata]XP_020867099.1 ubiquitin carboxyl-terminal hydrolase 15 isoform X2 [Arabidopsis lyrata subsp. lyrata]EFH69194.1 ubiquitin-specific protease 15 [Arabidopsis lyrata subsp. lyrata]|eukprot:XP_002892935.1 ubiquitin carboxyl-terminal hydrolase 15 isoform X2 [Arabidopsis lyrata subsp. lyrata]
MLEPRGADIPILFLVLVVLPVVAYILLGKWSDISEKRGRANLLAQMAAEEALRAETLVNANRGVRFESVATENRAQRTKTKNVSAASAAVRAEFDAGVSENVAEQRSDSVTATCGVPVVAPVNNNELHVCARCFGPAKTRCSRCKSVRYCSGKCQIIHWRIAHKDECVPLETCSSSSERVSFEKDSMLYDHGMDSTVYSNNTTQAAKGKTSISSVDFASLGISQNDITPQINTQGRKSVGKQNSSKSNRESSRRDSAVFDSSEEVFRGEAACAGGDNKKGHTKHKSRSNSYAAETNSRRHSVDSSCVQMNGQPFVSGMQESHKHENNLGIRSSFGCPNTQLPVNGTRTATLPKTGVNKSGEQSCTETSKKGQVAAVSKTVRSKDTGIAEESNGTSSTMGIMKMMGLRNSTKHDDRHKNLKMLFPYEEFLKFFQCEVFDLSPRGLVNCGNSCYANAVLQSLTCTKPLVAYLLRRSHSRSCSGKDWCLMCELEQHVMMLRESGGPLSASRILSHMRSINCQIGDGSQEDAHEFLRLLVASMQSICLERLGGETKVDPRLQETTLVQHMFGGRLRSKVKCLRCDHESERYENIMDLTLEIYGWVESLQDALTQFTRPEDLDGENMYRCSRCAGYVRARKELSIHEAPNILTIVLKRFQEGRYGKINKCISFPEMLDMIPFMTRTGDVPPLYMLYAVIVHLDTLNASFSGHYISYVKDLRGNWYRIDDSEIHRVPMTQVMSEGAYMLFYMRSYPRPQRGEHNGKAPVQHSQPRNEMKEQRKPVNRFKPRAEHKNTESSSSEWSLFTSSDEASFTTESTRDSFSTIDYTDVCHVVDSSSPFAIFNNVEPSPHNTVACRMFSGTKPETRYFVEQETNHNNTVVLDSSTSPYPSPSPAPYPSHDYYDQSMYVNYETNPEFNNGQDQDRTYSYW